MNRTLPNRLTLQMRLTISFITLAVLTSALVSGMVYLNARTQLRQDMRTRIESMLKIAALQIDADTMSSLTDPAQMESEIYLQQRETILHIQATSPDIGYLYTMRRGQDGQIYFVIDTGEDPAQLGEVNADASPVLQANFDTITTPLIETEFYTDRWGSWLSGYIPLYNLDGQRELILGMDLTASSVQNRQQQYLLFSLLSFLISIPLSGIAGAMLGRNLAHPLLSMTEAARKVTAGDLYYHAVVNTGDERQDLAEAMSLMTDRLRDTVATLEARIAERTAEIERRSRFIEAAADVGRFAASILDADQLIQDVVEHIRQTFNLYYVGLFLLDETGNSVVLRAGTGEAGRKLIARGLRRKVGEGMVGWAVANDKARIASEARQDLQRVPTSELPDTRSEAAIPLRSRGQVLGAITVQSSQMNAFDAQSVAVLQTMADQVATALDNAHLFAESQAAVNALEQVNLQLSQQAWSKLLQKRRRVAYRADETGLVTLDTSPLPVEQTQPEDSRVGSPHLLSVPVQVRGNLLGYLQAEKSPDQPPWSAEERTLLVSLVEQLNVALDNARLYSATQESAARERIISEITAKVRSSTSVNSIMQTAVRELAQALHVPITSIQLRPTQDDL